MLYDGGAAGRLLVFRVGTRRFGAELDWISGVVEGGGSEVGEGDWTEFRDRRVPVVDARALGWGCRAGTIGGTETAQLILGRGDDLVALVVDAVEGLAEPVEIRRWPAFIAPIVPAWFRGVAMQPEGGLLVVDPETLLSTARGAAGGAA